MENCILDSCIQLIGEKLSDDNFIKKIEERYEYPQLRQALMDLCTCKSCKRYREEKRLIYLRVSEEAEQEIRARVQQEAAYYKDHPTLMCYIRQGLLLFGLIKLISYISNYFLN